MSSGSESDFEDGPAPEALMQRIWRSPLKALQFLLHMKILLMPAHCPDGHEWQPSTTKKHCQWRCSKRVNKQKVGPDGEQRWYRGHCARKTTWRVFGSVMMRIPNFSDASRIMPVSVLVFAAMLDRAAGNLQRSSSKDVLAVVYGRARSLADTHVSALFHGVARRPS